MDINVKFKELHVPEEKKDSTHTWAVADVTANGVVIPNIRLINKSTNEGMEHFFAFPRIRSQTDAYQDVLVLSKEQKEEIQVAIGSSIQEYIGEKHPEIEVQKMSLCKNKGKLLAVATVKINGIGIQGVRLFEDEDYKQHVQFPQYRTRTGEWKNLVKLDSMFAVLALTNQMTREYKQISQKIQIENESTDRPEEELVKQESEIIKQNLTKNKKTR